MHRGAGRFVAARRRAVARFHLATRPIFRLPPLTMKTRPNIPVTPSLACRQGSARGVRDAEVDKRMIVAILRHRRVFYAARGRPDRAALHTQRGDDMIKFARW